MPNFLQTVVAAGRLAKLCEDNFVEQLIIQTSDGEIFEVVEIWMDGGILKISVEQKPKKTP